MNVVKDHVDYLKDNPKGYWFKRKLYGWGWTPATKKGWFTLGLYLVAVVTLALCAEKQNLLLSSEEVGAGLAVVTALFLVVVWKTGEPPRWQWGKDSSE